MAVFAQDGEDWNAEAAKINFDHIMGGKTRSRSGFHDWYGLAAAIESWAATGSMTFEVTFASYYEPALRELSVIRPFRMVSPKALPAIAEGYISCNDFKKKAPRIHGVKGGGYPNNPIPGRDILTCNGVKAPIGTGPYKVVDKLIATKGTATTRVLPAASFNASCWQGGSAGNGAPSCTCKENTATPSECVKDNEYVSEVRFEKFAGHRSKPTYDKVIVRAYKNQEEIKAAMYDGSLDMVYGVGAISPSTFIRLSTQEDSERRSTKSETTSLVSHRAKHVINTRVIVLNSLGALNTPAKRKLIMSIFDREPLIDGELAEEKRADVLFDPEMPYCNVKGLKNVKALAADGPAPKDSITGPLRFIYKKDHAHESIIAAKIIADLYTAGIAVEPIVLSKDDYNAAMNSWIGGDSEARTDDDAKYDTSTDPPTPPSYCTSNPPVSGQKGCISFDLAYSETWGPPYDPTSKLFDMTYEWGSGEADAVATTNMASVSAADFKTKVRKLSTIADDGARRAAYSEVLTILNNEAVFLPLTRKKNVAVVNSRVSGFKFGAMEFDIPVANLYPTPPDKFPVGGIVGIVVGVVAFLGLLIFVGYLIRREKRGEPMFTELPSQETAMLQNVQSVAHEKHAQPINMIYPGKLEPQAFYPPAFTPRV